MIRSSILRKTALARRTPLSKVGKKAKSRARDYELAKAAAWARDKGECQAVHVWPEVSCDGIRDPHHIASRRMYPELICDVDNLITLCRSHHRAAHGDPKTGRKRGLIR